MSAKQDTPVPAGKIVKPDGSACPLVDKLPAEIRLKIYKHFGELNVRLHCGPSNNWIAAIDADQIPIVNLLQTCEKLRNEILGECVRATVMATAPQRVPVTQNLLSTTSTASQPMDNTHVHSSLSPSGTLYLQSLDLNKLPFIVRAVGTLRIVIDINLSGIYPSIDAIENLMKALSWGEGLTELSLSTGTMTWWSSEDWSGFSDTRFAWDLNDLWDKLNFKARTSSQLPRPLEEGWFKCMWLQRTD